VPLKLNDEIFIIELMLSALKPHEIEFIERLRKYCIHYFWCQSEHQTVFNSRNRTTGRRNAAQEEEMRQGMEELQANKKKWTKNAEFKVLWLG
jgi:hypothetical protein